jgi:hypothetical protein
MNDSTHDVNNVPGAYDSSEDIKVLNMDGPGDLTVRPMPPHLVRLLREKEEHRARLMELWKQQQEQEKAKESSNTDNGPDSVQGT